MVKAVEELKKLSTKQLRSEEWSEEQGLVLFRGKVYVPKNIKLRLEIIKLHHDTPVAGHPGQWKTLELVTCNYWWPGIIMQVKNYVSGCDHCMKLPQNLERISPQTLLLASQKHKDMMHYLSHVAVIQNRHISFLHLQPLWPEV